MSSAVQPARRVAFEVIRAVSESDAYANLLLPVKLERAKLHGADAALATELTYGTLRQQGLYDRVIERAAGRPLERIDPPILDVLRLATHQLLSLRVAQHAAVDEAVSLARLVGSRSATGFVNGVLRTITRTAPDEWRSLVIGEQSTADDRLAAEFSHPVWIVRAFRQALAADGRDGDLDKLLSADNAAPGVTLAALPGRALREELGGTRPGDLSPVAAHSRGGDPSRLAAVRDGRARVQDEGSQLAALALSRARPIERGERWLDLCAGPGGKAALLAAEALAGGATLVANELSPARAGLVRNALAVFDDPPQVLEGDGRTLGHQLAGTLDRVLLDAPCTGLGALRRRPEARWRKQLSDLPALTALQLELTSAAAAALKPGGLLAYVTCSPHLAETRVAVAHAVQKCGLILLDTPAVLADIAGRDPDVRGDGAAQLWPHIHGTDAMFIALLEKPREDGGHR
ncbi:MAG: rRNA small subunit methyltransferase B [Micrococcales bacterium]|nr:rRNA small subunit methyltransferase B [Micrococcales bacterium]